MLYSLCKLYAQLCTGDLVQLCTGDLVQLLHLLEQNGYGLLALLLSSLRFGSSGEVCQSGNQDLWHRLFKIVLNQLAPKV